MRLVIMERFSNISYHTSLCIPIISCLQLEEERRPEWVFRKLRLQFQCNIQEGFSRALFLSESLNFISRVVLGRSKQVWGHGHGSTLQYISCLEPRTAKVHRICRKIKEKISSHLLYRAFK